MKSVYVKSDLSVFGDRIASYDSSNNWMKVALAKVTLEMMESWGTNVDLNHEDYIDQAFVNLMQLKDIDNARQMGNHGRARNASKSRNCWYSLMLLADAYEAMTNEHYGLFIDLISYIRVYIDQDRLMYPNGVGRPMY